MTVTHHPLQNIIENNEQTMRDRAASVGRSTNHVRHDWQQLGER